MPAPNDRTPTLLVAAFAAVSISFIASSFFTEYAARGTREAGDEIATDLVPGLAELFESRTHLHELRVMLERPGESADAPEDPEARLAAADTARRKLDQNLDRYRERPMRPRERELWADVERWRPALDRASAGSLASGSDPVSRPGGLGTVERWAEPYENLDSALLRLIDLEMEVERSLAGRVERLRHRSVVTALVLDGISLLLGLCVLLLVMRLVRRDRALVQSRAEELDMFASRMAHDVVNPLTAASLSFDLALRGLAGDEQLAAEVRNGKASLRQIQEQVEGLLAFARAGAARDAAAATELAPVVERVVAQLAPRLRDQRIELDVQVRAGHEVACDRGLLASVVSNLVGNAIKYMGDGPVRRIQVRALERGPSLLIEIEDTGLGVPPELGAKVFDPYVRAPGTRQPGLGLGLATVKRIVEAHGGHVGVTSTPGRGSRFWLELPRAAPAQLS